MRPDLGGVLRLPDVTNLVPDAAGLASETDGKGTGNGGGLGREGVRASRPLAIGNPLHPTVAGKGLGLW